MKVTSKSVCEHMYCNDKETLNLLIFSSSPFWKEVGREREDAERKSFKDWEMFCTYGKHFITGCKDESISMRIVTINS